MKTNGFILWQSQSVVCVITGLTRHSQNRKTGAMAQTYIMPRNTPPTRAIASGKDSLVCGDCPLRPANGGGCYVVVAQSVQSVWLAYKRGSYPVLTDYSVLRGHTVRIGAWGDPAFVPANVWQSVALYAAGVTGYTHQWRQAFAKPLQALCMASVNSPEEQIQATSQGWRTFRVKADHNPLFRDEIECPAARPGSRVTCERCRLCCGTSKPAKSIVINAHGSQVNRIQF